MHLATLALARSANPSIAGLHHYEVDVIADGGAWTSVVSSTTMTSANPTLPTGHRYTFRVIVTDNAGNVKDVSVDFTVSTGGGISTLMIGGIALVIVVIIVAALLLMRGRKGPPAEKKEPEK